MRDSVSVTTSYTLMAEQLEQTLGSPLDSATPFSFDASMKLDEKEEFPTEICTLLEDWGLQEYYVPARYGGKLHSLAELFTLGRVVARRDLSVAIAHSKTFLGSAPVWIAGTPEQKNALARRILNREYIALALTEEEHGGDLAASECTARKIHDRYLLSGTKWLVNNATRSTALCLLARTRARGGALGTSLFLIEKEHLDPTSFSYLPKIKTHGIRGIDISGIRFENSVLGEQVLLGKEHHGLEPIFKTFQITRPLCSALSLGAADTALRLALAFSLQRYIYSDTVFSLSAAREVLIQSFIDILIGDCMALFAARALHVLPEQMSLWSSVTKYFVPTLMEDMVQHGATILGARYYLREHYASGVFQKIVRDIAIVSLFDGSTRLNLSLIASQFGQIVQPAGEKGIFSSPDVIARLERTCSLSQPLPEFEVNNLLLRNRGQDDLRLGLLNAVEQLDLHLKDSAGPSALKADLRCLLSRFAREREVLDQAIQDLILKQGEIHTSAEAFELARTHCILHAASVCFYTWLFNRSTLEKDFVEGHWLILCLARLLKLLFPCENLVSLAPYSEQVAEVFLRLFHEDRLFSIVPVQLASPRVTM